MNAVTAATSSDTAEPEGGPMWGRFFDSIGGDDNDSVVSGSHSQIPTDMHPNSHLGPPIQSPRSEVHPNDSASVQEDDDHGSVVDGYVRGKHAAAGHSVVTAPGSSMPVDDGTYIFKFRTPSGRTHRFQSRHDNVEHLREVVAGKLATDPFFTESKVHGDVPPDPEDFHLSYTDADGDTVLITSDHDVTESVKIARAARSDRVVLFVQGGKGWSEAGADKGEAKAAQANAAARLEEKEMDNAEIELVVPEFPQPAAPAPTIPAQADAIFGIPKDLLLPASIGALAVVIIGVFTISRMSDRY